MPILNVTRSLFLAATIAVLPASGLLAAPFQPKQVPADAKWVVHIDADATKNSTVCDAIKDVVLRRPDVQRGLSDVEGLTGVKVPDDIKSVTIYGRQFGEENNVVLIDGKFDTGRILGVLELGPAYSSESYGAHEIVSWDDKGKTMYGSFLGSSLVIIARSVENVKAAYDVLDSTKPSLTGVSTDATSQGAGAIVYLAGNGLAELAKEKGASPLFGRAKAAWLVLGEKQEKVFVKGHVESPDAEQAERLTKAAEGIRALVSLKASQEDADEKTKMLDNLLQPLKLTQVTSGIDLDWSTPATTVVDTVKTVIAQRQGKMTGN